MTARRAADGIPARGTPRRRGHAVPLRETTPEQRERVRRLVMLLARDDADRDHLLGALGLDAHDTVKEKT